MLLKDDNGTIIFDQGKMKKLAIIFFKAIYEKPEMAGPRFELRGLYPAIPEDMFRDLGAEITDEEIQRSVFDMKPLTAPGMDGLNVGFFQSMGSGWKGVL